MSKDKKAYNKEPRRYGTHDQCKCPESDYEAKVHGIPGVLEQSPLDQLIWFPKRVDIRSHSAEQAFVPHSDCDAREQEEETEQCSPCRWFGVRDWELLADKQHGRYGRNPYTTGASKSFMCINLKSAEVIRGGGVYRRLTRAPQAAKATVDD